MALASARRDPQRALTYAREGAEAAEAAGDEALAAFMLAMVAAELAETGDFTRARGVGDDAIRRSRAAAHQPLVRGTEVTVAVARVWSGRTDDAEAAILVLEELDPRGLAPRLAASTHLAWGGALVLTQQPGAARHLATAIGLADRHHLLNLTDIAARLLAVAVARGGETTAAAQLAGYAGAHTSSGWMTGLHERWIGQAVEAALRSLTPEQRAREIANGEAMSRREFLSLVSRLADL